MTSKDSSEPFLRPPEDNEEYEAVYRQPSNYNPLPTFELPLGRARHYQQQYADLYFLRLARLKPAVTEIAAKEWEGYNIANEYARKVDRVLDVRQGELCWVAGTIYMELPLKPNIIDDIAKEHWTSAPPPRRTYLDPSKPGSTEVMLEDESGRLRLTGPLLQSALVVTGVIVAILGTENANGDFEVIDVKVPDLPSQPERWERDGTSLQSGKRKRGSLEGEGEGGKRKKIALVSGLGITGTSGDTLALSLLTDYLVGCNDPSDGSSSASEISRLVIAGNSLGSTVAVHASGTETPTEEASTLQKKRQPPRKYGYDSTNYNASPINQLDSFLAEILPSIPITIMPGENDPANFSLPQQEIHRAMLPRSKAYCSPPRQNSTDSSADPGWLDNVTNPWEGNIEGWRFWGCSGQNVDDVLRYIDRGEDDNDSGEDRDGDARLRLMEAMLRWRVGVPTAPDTLWCYPFQTHDPFTLQSCPHLFFAGSQPRFRTAIVEAGDGSGTQVRILSLPKFSETGELILVDAETLEVEVVKFGPFEANKDEANGL
ncbi:hypothetical protein AJ80_04570 [Polytolypa hystricis UAMH7299]|uniref:DNA-directed DNA polymerase n=1 Tax=Polytolypa hystricis (strain UAMH7299) TaxID=1447883 RepID=A0A2B7YAW9_POLH7|nr:hypothetical protein AJ80_04570 [Polytolypa hystricis UAMH7299]